MRKALGLLLVIGPMIVFGAFIYQKTMFKKHVSGYLKRAADANTIELAHEELTRALTYLEENDLTKGYTSVLYETPDEDIGFWYRNLKASKEELEKLENPSALERTNVLMKLRETLTDSGEKTRVTTPDGIHLYPNNAIWAGLGWGSLVAFFWGLILLVPKEEWDKMNAHTEAQKKAKQAASQL